MSEQIKKQKLFVRQAELADVPALHALNKKVYGYDEMSEKEIRSQINAFPEGQFVAEFDGKIVGHAVTFMIDEWKALRPHTWNEITGNGYASRHDPYGDVLYGMDVVVDPDMRRSRIGERLYNMRKKLCKQLGLRGIVFGGRMPNYHKHAKKGVTPEEYLELVKAKKVRDPVLGFQFRNGFEYLGILKNYIPTDDESLGYAAHMIWRNELSKKRLEKLGRRKGSVRLATVQFQVDKAKSFDEFMGQVEYYVRVASDYNSDFVTFPELFTLVLVPSRKHKLTPEEVAREMTGYTEKYIAAMRELAVGYNINIIGGSHPTYVDEELKNISYVFLRGGEVHQQAKIHPTPNECRWWNMTGGDDMHVINTDCGPIGVLICYDAEFPELARHLTEQGALILFVPFCTDSRQGFLRVKYCSQARAIENQVYVVTSGVVGDLEEVDNMDIHYATSFILTPCDYPFARDGIAAETDRNTESIIFADVNIDDLILNRSDGTVQNFKDRRFDLYEVKWRKG